MNAQAHMFRGRALPLKPNASSPIYLRLDILSMPAASSRFCTFFIRRIIAFRSCLILVFRSSRRYRLRENSLVLQPSTTVGFSLLKARDFPLFLFIGGVLRIFLVETNPTSPAPECSRLIAVRIASSSGRAPSRAIVWLALVFLTTVWAVNFIAGKIALRYLPAMTLASIRVVLAGVFMILLNPLCRRLPAFRKPRAGGSLDSSANPAASSSLVENALASPPRRARELLFSSTSHKSRTTLHDLWTFLYLGFLGVTVNQVCFTIGLHYTSVTHSAIIVGMGPIYALVLAKLFRLESATLRKILGMIVSLLGVLLLATSRNSAQHLPSLLGDFTTFIGSLGFAFYAVLGKRVAARYDALTMTTYNFLFGALFVLPLAINRAIAIGPVANWLAIRWPAWAGMIYMALFSSTLAYLFYFWLLRYLEVTQLAAYNYLLPVSAALLGIVFLGERGSWAELLGGGLALAGVYFVEATGKS